MSQLPEHKQNTDSTNVLQYEVSLLISFYPFRFKWDFTGCFWVENYHILLIAWTLLLGRGLGNYLV